jgi:outer membrane protein, multidrug efflux system
VSVSARMRRPSRILLPRIALFGVVGLASSVALAGPLDLDDAPTSAPAGTSFGTYVPPPPPQPKGHAYSLAECLALTDRNHPNLWAARARLAYVHAQLDEATWVPFWQFTANAGVGVLPPLYGTIGFGGSPTNARDITLTQGLEPIIHFDLSGTIPLYTFGKITSVKEAAKAQVRVSEWDLEKVRQQSRLDVRRAYFGLMTARDARYLADEIKKELDKAIAGVKKKIAKDDKAVSDVDQLRLEVLLEEVAARSGDAAKNETQAMAALRFLTGVERSFDVPDEPLRPPSTPLAPVERYLSAARTLRPEVNLAHAGVAARKAQVDLARARLFPDIGIVLGTDYTAAPGVTPQTNVWAFDPFNHFYYSVGFGARWSLDLLPGAARVAEAESQLEETRALQRLALGGLAVEVETAYAAVVEARSREESWSRAEHKAKQWISTIEDQIDLGTQDEKALTEPLRAYVNARAQHLLAIMDSNLTLSQLALATGLDSAAPP